ncbi:DNA-binding transcriptional MerR regulator [Bosea sp. OAE506]|uniref:MerR family transcriptional regulator n=1 Tax=Bosea sp. OAE506 TaxID=2663870 RepID=UPI00178A3470
MKWYSIRQLADEFGLTLRAIRFYEERGLLSPSRICQESGAPRVFNEDDRSSLGEIVNLTKMGFTISEISKGRITDQQYKAQLTYCTDKIDELEKAVLLIEERLNKR